LIYKGYTKPIFLSQEEKVHNIFLNLLTCFFHKPGCFFKGYGNLNENLL